MTDLKIKIKRTIEKNKLNLKILGERKWNKYFIRVTELIWARNNHDGYKIEIYSEKYGKYLDTIII